MAKRRTKGHGGVRKRNGLYYPYYPLKDANGRQIKDADGKPKCIQPTPRSFEKRGDADGWLRATRQKQDSVRTAHGYTIHAAVSDYIDTKRDYNAPSTIKTDERTLRRVESQAKSMAIADATPISLSRWLAELPATPHQRKSVFRLLRATFNWLESIEQITRTPMRALKSPKHDPEKPDPFTKEESRQILAAVKDHDYESFFVVELMLGLRPGEAFGLLWDSVNLKAGTIHIHRTLEEIDGKLRLKETVKTKRSNRVLALPALALEALKKHAAKGNRQGAVWKAPRGGWLYTGTFRSRVWLPLIVDTLGLRERKVYNLRHTALTLMLLEGLPVRLVSEIAGHSSTQQTLNTYAHLFDNTQQTFAPRIDAIFRETPSDCAHNSGNADCSTESEPVKVPDVMGP